MIAKINHNAEDTVDDPTTMHPQFEMVTIKHQTSNDHRYSGAGIVIKPTQLTIISKSIHFPNSTSSTNWVLANSAPTVISKPCKDIDGTQTPETEANLNFNLEEAMMTQLKHKCECKWSKTHTRKLILLLISLTIIFYGVVLLFMVVMHFNHAEKFCNILVEERLRVENILYNDTMIFIDHHDEDRSDEVIRLLDENSELFVWDFCINKVHPFNDICQCRNFYINFMDSGTMEKLQYSAEEIEDYFGINFIKVLMNVFRKCDML